MVFFTFGVLVTKHLVPFIGIILNVICISFCCKSTIGISTTTPRVHLSTVWGSLNTREFHHLLTYLQRNLLHTRGYIFRKLFRIGGFISRLLSNKHLLILIHFNPIWIDPASFLWLVWGLCIRGLHLDLGNRSINPCTIISKPKTTFTTALLVGVFILSLLWL